MRLRRAVICWSIVLLLFTVEGVAEHTGLSVRPEIETAGNPLSRFDRWVKEEPYQTIYKRSSILKDFRSVLPKLLASKDEGRTKDFENIFHGLQVILFAPTEDNDTILLRHLVTELGLVAASDKDGRVVYEQNYGGLSKKMLGEVREKGNLKLLEELVFRYPFSLAGLEALDLFATHHLDRGQYELASFYFDLLKERQQRLGGVLSPLTQYKMILSEANRGKEWKESFHDFSDRNPRGIVQKDSKIPLSSLEKFINHSVAQAATLSKTLPRNEDLLTVSKAGFGAMRFYPKDFVASREFKKVIAELEKKGHFNFVKIGPGSFLMGSPATEERRGGNETQHKVNITKEFYVLDKEVTQALYKLVMGSNPSSTEGEDLPVTNVSWDDITEKGGFLEKLNKLDPKHHYRLLTEAEWEYAVRGGTQAAYSFGDDVNKLKEYAWFSENSENIVHPVGQRKANAYGLYDIHGNVWEWVQDYYDAYPSSEDTDPTGPASGDYRVIRGGGWLNFAEYARSAYRNCRSPGSGNSNLGLRLVRTPRNP